MGAVAGEIVGEKYLQGQVPAFVSVEVTESDLIQQTGNVARLAGGFVAGAAGGDVNVGAQTGGFAAENNAIQFVPIMLTAAFVAAVHSAAVGISALVDSDGNPLEALRKVGRKEDSLTAQQHKAQEKIAESSFGKMVANGKAEISRVAYEAFPEQIDAINRGLERLNNGVGLVLTYADLLTGQKISRFWKDVPLAVKEALAGLTRLAPAAAGLGFGGKILTNFIISKDVTKMVGAGRAKFAKGNAPNVNDAVRLKTELAFKDAGILDNNGRLTEGAIKESRILIEGDKLTNPSVISTLTKDGSNIQDWGKYTTDSVRMPNGESRQIHFYRNRKTGTVDYETKDFKVKDNVSIFEK